MGIGTDTNAYGTLFHCLHGILYLEDTALGRPSRGVVVILVTELQSKREESNYHLI